MAYIFGSMAYRYVTLVLVLVQFCVVVFGDDVCYVDSTNRWETCENGCCGRSYENNRRCCSDTDVLVWIIVGSVIGGIVFIAFLVACICCFIKSKGKKGRVINPSSGGTGQTTTMYQMQTYPMAPYNTYPAVPTAPPAYMANPPAYSQTPYPNNQYGQPPPVGSNQQLSGQGQPPGGTYPPTNQQSGQGQPLAGQYPPPPPANY